MRNCIVVLCVVAVTLGLSSLAWAVPTPLANFKLDEGQGGLAKDSVSGEMDGTLYGARYVRQGRGYALDFDGTNDYVAVSNSALNRTGDVTVECWFRVDDADATWRGLCGTYESGNGGYMLVYTTGSISFYEGDGPSSVGGAIPGTVEGQWHHAAGVYDESAGTMTVYIDGDSKGVISDKTLVSSSVAFDIGRFSGSNYFNGAIDDVVVYDTALSSTDVKDRYKQTKDDHSLGSAGLTSMAYYRLDEGQGSSTMDSITGDMDGTLYGAQFLRQGRGYALDFDGTNDYVAVSNSNLNRTGDVTVECWFRVDDDDATWRGLCGTYVSGQGGYMLVYTSGSIRFYEGGGYGSVGGTIPGTVEGQWHHAAGVYDESAGTMTIYIDGDSKEAASGRSLTSSPSGFSIGSYGGSNYFNGVIDDVVVYDTALNSVNVKARYDETKGDHDNRIIARYSFEDGSSGVVQDSSGHAYHGTLTGGQYVTQGRGYALLCDGTSDYASVSSSALNRTNDLTVECWFKLTDQDSTWRGLCGTYASGQGGYMLVYTSGSIRFYEGGDYGSVGGAIPSAVEGQWHHAAGVYDESAGTMTIYIDGVNKETASGQSLSSSPSGFSIGCYSGGNYFDGTIDEVIVYNTALSSTEIAERYNSSQKERDNDLVAHYTFEEGSGATVYDWSGNGNNGSNTGATYADLGASNGHALAFDGTDVVNCGNGSSLNLTDEITIELWFKPQTEVEQGEAGLVGKNYDSYLVTYCGKNVWFYIGNGSGNYCHIGAVVDSWQHIVARFDGDELQLYRDGKLTALTPSELSTIPTSAQNLYLRYPSVYGTVSPPMQCMMDDVRIYNRALSEKEIIAHYEEGAAQKGKDVTWFDKMRVTPHVYPLASTLIVEADFHYLKPLLTQDATVVLELWNADGTTMLDDYAFSPLSATGRGAWVPSPMCNELNILTGSYKAEWVLDTTEIQPGTYEVRAKAVDGSQAQLGDSSSVSVELPEPPAWLNANPEVAVLNNLVIQLLNVEEPEGASEQQYSIATPRKGWVYISSTASTPEGSQLCVVLDGAPQEEAAIDLVYDGNESETGETMRHLSAGDHTIEVYCEGGSTLTELVVRAVPELLFPEIGYEPSPWVSCYGPYDWDWLETNGVLDNVNTLLERDALSENTQHCLDWRAQGRKILTYSNITGLLNSNLGAYDYLMTLDGFSEANRDGAMMDEFDSSNLPPDQEDYALLADAVRTMSNEEECDGKVFYPYGKEMTGSYASDFLEALFNAGFAFAEEVYLHEQPTETGATQYLDARLRQRMLQYHGSHADCQKNMIMNMGYMSIPKETLNTHPNADWKVFMDMEMNLLANDPVFSELYGVAWYHAAYADEEALRWAAQLFRHYCIEGSTDMLSGGSYSLSYVGNGDFEQSAAGWTLTPAETGSITAESMDYYGWLQGRYPRTPQGDTFLVTTRSAVAPNRFSRQLTGLQANGVYSVEMFVADNGDISQGISAEKQLAMNISLTNVEVITEKSIELSFSGIHPVGAFTSNNPAWMTYRRVYFRAQGTTATLTVSDWLTDQNPGGTIGQKLMFNFIEVQPYLE